MKQDLTVTVFSDGWTDVDHHLIVNVIMGVLFIHSMCVSIDTMGLEKTMEFITDLILQHIKSDETTDFTRFTRETRDSLIFF